MKRDMISLRDEALQEGEPLLQRVMDGGKVTQPHPRWGR